MDFLVLPKVTVDLPTTTVNTEGWILPDGIQLADPTFFQFKEVDVVLGIEAFFEYVETGRRISIGTDLPNLTESVFGWLVCRGLSSIKHVEIGCHFSATSQLEKLLEVEFPNSHSPEEQQCESLFQSKVRRGPDGRYTVPLLKNEDVLSKLGDSRAIAFRWRLGTERRLAKDANLRNQYVSFMDEYARLGHMRKVEDPTKDIILWSRRPVPPPK
ncbi:uncharacterized protein LOC134222103 [Armigeres subalbatus]|uniref:uncharacterized protein LOC134222103 n=1 Tax=Armigeres subalbatus TaxID=124917 RepID=UPI002ED0F3AE